MGNINGENVSAQQESVAKTVWDYLGSQGFNEISRAAILGNMWQESRMRPDAMQNGPVSAESTKGGYAYGLIQWDGGRRSNLLRQLGNNWSDVNSQLDFLISEFNGPEKGCFKRGGVYSSVNDFKNAAELSTATNQFCTCFERAGTPNMSTRISAAEYFFEAFTGTSPTSNNGQNTHGGGGRRRTEDGSASQPFESFFEAGYLDFGDNNDLTAAMFDELVKLDDGRRINPIRREDNIGYGDRQYETIFNLTLGDCTVVIPPEFISVTEESSTQSLVTLRQESTQKIKNGYSRRLIVLDVVFHGVNQINGYKVPGPEGWYYVDGLRQLLAEFKCTPFLPIKNWTINYTYNIWTVALQSIIISTMPGYPDVLTAHITLQEVDLFPYLESHTMFFEEFIDWDLFRFYYQRQLTESHEYGKLQSISRLSADNKFKMSILSSAVFDANIDYTKTDNGETIDFYDIIFDRKVVVTKDGKPTIQDPDETYTSNFIPYLDSEEDNVQIFEFHTGYSNIITNIQMAEMAHPTVQYMGGMDTNFQIVFETTSDFVIQKIQTLTSQNNSLIRNNRDYTGVGFVKLESELVQFTGTTFVMIDSITTSTVPGFPGLYTVQLNCLSFDAYQKESEGIKGHSPFFVDGDPAKSKIGDYTSRSAIDEDHPKDGKGHKSDAIKQSIDGLYNKIRQDLCFEQKMREDCNLFPDLKLPTYAEVDEVIQKIIAFRNSNVDINGNPLEPYPLQHYPRTPQRMLHGINTVSNMDVNGYGFVTNVGDIIDSAPRYDLYVDPDFYVFYPETYKELIKSTEADLEEMGASYVPSKPEARQSTYVRKYIPSSGSDSDVSTGNSAIDKFINVLKSRLGCSYVLGATGPNTFDCTGLIVWAMNQCGINVGRFTTGEFDKYVPEYFTLKATGSASTLGAQASIGDVFYRPPGNGKKYGHVGVYVGNGLYIHAPQSGDVVKYSEIGYANFTRLYSINALTNGSVGEGYDDNDDGTTTYSGETTIGPTYHVNMNLSMGDSGDEVKQLQKILNHITGSKLDLDGKYGSLTKQAVEDFQTWYNANFGENISVDGIVGPETSAALENTLNNGPKNNYVETETTTSDNYQITETQLQNIARTIANMQFGKPEAAHYAMAQMIYDRATDPNAKYGTINNIISSHLFNGMTSKDIAQSTAYSCAKSVFCNGNRIFPTRCINYNGTDASAKNLDGLNQLGQYGEFTFYGDGKQSSTKNFTIVDSIQSTTNEVTTTTNIQNGVEAVNADWVKLFGRPVVVKTTEMLNDDSGLIVGLVKGVLNGLGNSDDLFDVQEERYGKNNYNSDKNILLSSFCNQAEYSAKGRLAKAFPTYAFTIIDEDGNWLDGRKLWANCYFMRSAVEIQTAAYDDSPIHTATITVTNSYGNLSRRQPNDTYYSVKNDKGIDGYNWLQRWAYETFNILPSFVGLKLTSDLVERKNIIAKSMIVRAGCRCQLRMGYGSDPLGLPVVLNGYISDLSAGDILTMVCVSDGVELTNAVISDNPKDVNGIFESQESSNMCIDILSKRGNILNTIVAEWGEASKYGIEHFGLYFSRHVDLFPTVNWGNGVLWDAAEGVVNFAGGTVEAAVTILKDLGSGLFTGWKTIQYDLIKNLYRGNYSSSLAMYSPFWGFADGEKNICFSQYNKTPWDVVQISAQNEPEYLGYPLYHQFESRLFLGLPYWLAKYRYNMINGELYEEAKAFAQTHFVDSLGEIIDNQMKCTGRNVFTNAIVMYTLGKSPKATPTLYSDRSMNTARQSTKIYDSSVTQNLIGPDALWEFLGIEQGKNGAIRLGISQLLINWAKAYKGDIMILGDAGIFPNDYIYLNDRFNRINGMCTARCVTHTLSCNTGFITTFTPGMIGFSNLQNSQGHVTITNLTTIGSAFSYFTTIKKAVKENAEVVAAQYCFNKTIAVILKHAQIIPKWWVFNLGVKTGMDSVDKAADIWKAFRAVDKSEWSALWGAVKNLGPELRKSLDAVKDVGKFTDKVKDFFQAYKGFDAIFDIVKTGGIKALGGTVGSAVPGVGTLIGFAVGILLDVLLEKVIEYFMYKHCINLLPMMRDNMCYAPHWGQNLLLNYNEDPDTSPYGEKDKEYSNEGDIEDTTKDDSGEYTISGSNDPDSDEYDKTTYDID